MNEFDKAREKYLPKIIKFLFIANSLKYNIFSIYYIRINLIYQYLLL